MNLIRNQQQRIQSGFVLITAMLMLGVVTILATLTITNGLTNLRVTENMESRFDAETLTQRTLEQMLSDLDNFTNPQTKTITIDGHAVQVTQPACLNTSPAEGYTALWDLSPETTNWSFNSSFADPDTGAAVSMTQGVNILLNADNCP